MSMINLKPYLSESPVSTATGTGLGDLTTASISAVGTMTNVVASDSQLSFALQNLEKMNIFVNIVQNNE